MCGVHECIFLFLWVFACSLGIKAKEYPVILCPEFGKEQLFILLLVFLTATSQFNLKSKGLINQQSPVAAKSKARFFKLMLQNGSIIKEILLNYY